MADKETELGKGEGWSFSADRPIPSRQSDRFQRAPFADALVGQILALPGNDSFVLGLVGPWGSGKTSILAMAEETMAEHAGVVILRFNPWLFSGTEQLAAHFFQELAAQLHESRDKSLREIGDKMVRYSEALSPLSALPIIGKWAEHLASSGKFFGGLLKRSTGELPASVMSQRRQIERLLTGYGKRMVVVIDDIDRLPKADIRELFKLVRLTADFPNTTYLLAFDRGRVEEALSETEGEGRAYLEKILQVTFDVPLIRQPDLAMFLITELDRAVEGRQHGPFDLTEWTNIFSLVVAPIFKTPRDVRRYTNAIPVALTVIGEEIALADVLAMEAIRCMLPEVWAQLAQCQELLTSIDSRSSDARQSEQRKTQLNGLIELAKDNSDAVRNLLVRVFPASRRYIDNHHYGPDSARQWEKTRRLASESVLRFYFEKSLPPDVLRSSAVQDLFRKSGDEPALRAAFNSLDSDMIEHACSRLEMYEEEFSVEVAETALIVLFEQYPRLREERRGFFDFGAGLAVTRLALRLLRGIEAQEVRDSVIQRVFARIPTLSARVQFVDLVGWREKVGHELSSRKLSAQMEEALERAVLSASASSLAGERDLVEILRWADDGGEAAPRRAKELASDNAFMLRLLRSRLGESGSRPLGDVAWRSEHTLPWLYLCDLIGEDELSRRVNELAAACGSASLEPRAQLALETAVRYSRGWRPKRFGETQQADKTAPGTATEFPERSHGTSILLDLIASVVDSRRATARDRIGQLVENGRPVSRELIDKLTQLATHKEQDEVEQVATCGLLLRASLETDAVRNVTLHWIANNGTPSGLKELLQREYADASRVEHLVSVLESLDTAGAIAVTGVDEALHLLGDLLENGLGCDGERGARISQMVERFGAVDELAAARDRVLRTLAHVQETG